MPAFSDSTAEDMGIDTIWSQFSLTRRDRPLPSDPVTMTIGSVASSRAGSWTSPSMSSPRMKKPALRYSSRVRVRFAARATGTRAAAPADVFQALAVIPTERRSGTTTPWPPKAATERIMAPRLRGSVIPSSATTRGMPGACGSMKSLGCAYSYGGTWRARPWCTAPSVSRSSAPRGVSSTGIPRAVAIFMASRTRSSASMRPATYIVVTGTSARRASTTELRPATTSLEARERFGAPWPPERADPRAPGAAARLATARARRAAGCFSRSTALGVGPRPSRPLRRWPPLPTVAPFLDAPLRVAPRRWELPAMCESRLSGVGVPGERPARARGGVLDGDARRGQLVADGVRGREVARGPGGLARGQPVGHERLEGGHRLGRRGAGPGVPSGVEGVDAEHLGHLDHGPRRPGGGVVVALVESCVARTDGVVDDGKGAGDVEVVVHRGRELRRQLRGGEQRLRVVESPSQEALDAVDRGLGLAQRRLVVLDRRAVVRRAQVVAEGQGPGDLGDLGDEQGVAERLAHLLAADGDPGVVQPVAREPEPGRARLGLLVLVVREAQVDAAAVDVERLAQVLAGHRRALDVPARAARPVRA